MWVKELPAANNNNAQSYSSVDLRVIWSSAPLFNVFKSKYSLKVNKTLASALFWPFQLYKEKNKINFSHFLNSRILIVNVLNEVKNWILLVIAEQMTNLTFNEPAHKRGVWMTVWILWKSADLFMEFHRSRFLVISHSH